MARLLQEGIEECVQWGDRDTQALLLVESAELKARRGKTAESVAALQVLQPKKSCNLLWVKQMFYSPVLDLFATFGTNFGKCL